ncbi:MAG: glycosyl hydrolase family 18 protein [Wolinella sp.]
MRVVNFKRQIVIAFLLSLSLPLHGAPFERLIYLVDRHDSYEQLSRNIDSFDVIAPQVFSFGSDGVLYGEVDERIIKLAQKHQKKLMPLVKNEGFDKEKVQRFLKDEEAKKRLINALAEVGKRYGFAGWQLDFEHLGTGNRALYSDLVKRMHSHLRKYRMQLSIAVIPARGEEARSVYGARFYANWIASYDFKTLAKHSDFLSVMAYDQHTGKTPPGAVASYPWVERIIKEMLKEVSRDKISLGIPLYSRLWYAGNRGDSLGSQARSMSYVAARDWILRRGITPIYSESERIWWGFGEHGGIREYLFLEEVDSFAEKIELAKRYKLRGVSLWRLGQEDARIYEKLQK